MVQHPSQSTKKCYGRYVPPEEGEEAFNVKVRTLGGPARPADRIQAQSLNQQVHPIPDLQELDGCTCTCAAAGKTLFFEPDVNATIYDLKVRAESSGLRITH